MRRIVLALCLWCCPALAQVGQLAVVQKPGAAAPAYTGPGDIVSGASFFYGVRGYNAAYATGSNVALQIKPVGGTNSGSTKNIVILTSGALDIATANAWAGTDATCTGTIATTTITCASASSTPHVGSTVTGTSVNQPCVATAVGSFVGGAGTVTASLAGTTTSCGTVSVGETITFQYAMPISSATDQTGNGITATPPSAGQSPQLLPDCGNAVPCMFFLAANSDVLNGTGGILAAQPFTFLGVAKQVGTAAGMRIIDNRASASNGSFMGFNGTSGLGEVFSGGIVTYTLTTNALHSVQYIANTPSSVTVVDGSSTSTAALSNGTNGQVGIGGIGLNNSGAYMNGYIPEGGQWPSAFNATQYGNQCHNAYVYYGSSFGASC